MKPLSPEEFERRKREGLERGRIARQKTVKFLGDFLDKTGEAAERAQNRLTKGIHKVMGSDEYKRQALEVNARLSVAVEQLEDSIKRRDEEISRLRIRLAELEGEQRA